VERRHRGLDGLRALCVAGVILAGYDFTLPCGWIGVLVFYVLSGFLITRILLRERADVTRSAPFFGRFYFRRSVRIVPLYLAYLSAVEIVHLLAHVPADWSSVRPYAFTYLVNVGIMLGDIGAGPAHGHLWTLAVEEQFYLVWPLFVWLLPRHWLGRCAMALVLLGPLVRHVCYSVLGWSIGELYVASTTHVDALATGALLAVYPVEKLRHARRWALGSAAFALAVGILNGIVSGIAFRFFGYPEGLGLAFGTGFDHGYTHVWGYTLLNLTAAAVIVAAWQGELRLLEHPVLVFVGKISYGIYLFQRPIIGIYQAVVRPDLSIRIGSPIALAIIGLALCVGASIAAAAVSYRYLEGPLLAWRDRKLPPLPARVEVAIATAD
jgi:peptidoglycan/LPS O-acetylase OafA/YrhL